MSLLRRLDGTSAHAVPATTIGGAIPRGADEATAGAFGQTGMMAFSVRCMCVRASLNSVNYSTDDTDNRDINEIANSPPPGAPPPGPAPRFYSEI